MCRRNDGIAYWKFDVVFFETIQFWEGRRGDKCPVDPQVAVAFAGRPFGEILVDALSVDHQRGEHTDPLASVA